MIERRAEDRLEEGRKRLAEIERRIGPFMPKVKVRDGVKRTEWRSDNSALKAHRAPKKNAR
jgi:hypothetical protein